MKRCTKCNLEKTLTEFPKDNRKPGRLQAQCKKCQNVRISIWRNNNKDKHAATTKRSRVKRQFGLTDEMFHNILASQEFKCAICGTLEPTGKYPVFNVDHCHATGKVRGLLCHHCNTGIGNLKDDPEIVLKALKYLTKVK
jgi:hypothetical protein